MNVRRAQAERPPSRAVRRHLWLGAAVTAVSTGAYLWFRVVTAREPSRGYTPLGLWLGGVGTAQFLGVVLYSLRKRAGQEWRWLPGRLQTWLQLHVWLSAVGLVLVLLHAGFHFDHRPGTWAVSLLAATLLSGLVGGWFYLRVPGAVARGPGNLSTTAARDRVRNLEERMEDAAAGRSLAVEAEVAGALGRARREVAGPVASDDREVLEHVRTLAKERREELVRIATQERLRARLRGWLWVHVPTAIVFLLAIPWHVYDALELRWAHRTAGPRDYADPLTCAECHPNQYSEWLVSSHVTAQSSPIMDLQYRALLAKERRENDGKAPVATLCVTCHAPLGNITKDEGQRESVELAVERRAPASATGISCVTCHQIAAVHAADPSRDPDGLTYVNMENLRWTEGRTMFGSFGADGDPAIPSVGNDAHRGVFGSHLLGSEFCASCHTVRVVKAPQGERKEPARVVLQNTYEEWKSQFLPLEAHRGFDRRQALQCMHCHSMDLSSVAATARRLATERTPLAERRAAIVTAIRGLTVDQGKLRAAEPADGFDLPLPPRRRFLHTFVGVDLHTEDDQPILPPDGETVEQRSARHARNLQLHADREVRTHDLLAVAAGVRVESLSTDGTLKVEIANLATGHKLPAGFAFAREFWLEVSVARAGTRPEDESAWTRWVGGTADGKPLPAHQRLPRDDPNIHNLQAVLFDDDAIPGPEGVETVLQTEVTAVLTGEAARKRGFKDREKPLSAGESEVVSIRLDPDAVRASLRAKDEIRVRMLFRNLPVEFLERLAERYEGAGATDDDRRQAARARAIVHRLRILTVAEDTVGFSTLVR